MSSSRFWCLGLFWLLASPVWAKDSDQIPHDIELGLAAYQFGNLRPALEIFNMIITQDSSLQFAYAARAQVYEDLGNKIAAQQDLKLALPMKASDPITWTLRGTALVLDGTPERGIEDFNLALEKDPHYALAYLARGRAYRALGDFKKASDDWTSALSLDPKLAMAFYERADTDYRLGNSDQAVKDLTQALLTNPKFSLAYSLLGTVLAIRGDDRRALAAYTKAIDYDSKNISPYLGRAAVELHAGNKDAAMKDYAQAITLAPEDYVPYYSRGEALWQLGDRNTALADFSKASELEVPDARAARQMADRLQEGGELEKALKLYTKSLDIALRSHTKDQNILIHDVLLSRSRVYAKLQDTAKAEKDLNEAIRLFPNSAAAWTERGKFYLQFLKMSKAADDFEKALSIDPKYVPARVALGKLKAAQGQTEEARKDFNAAIEQDPQSADAYGNRSLMDLRLGDEPKAFEDISQAVSLAPNDPQWNYHLGIIEVRRRNFRKAIGSFNKTLSLEPPSVVVLEQRAQAYAMLGDQESSLKDIRAGLDIDPKSTQLQIALSGIHLRAWQPAQALNALEQAEKINSKSFALRSNLGVVYGIEGKYGKSADEFKRATVLDPKSAQSYTALCRALRLAEDYRSSERACQKAEDLDSKYAMAYIDHGMALLFLKDFEGAAAELLNGYRLGARYAGAELARSVAHAALRQYAQSDAAYRSAMDLDLWAREPQVGFGPKISGSRDYSAWINTLEKQLERDQDDPAVHLVLGNAFANKGEPDKAISEYTKAMQINGTSAGAYSDRCAAYATQSQMDPAEEDCRHAVELEPNDPQMQIRLLETMVLKGDYRKGLGDAANAIHLIPHSPALFARVGNLRYFLKDIPHAQENYQLALQADPDFSEGYNGLGLCELFQGKNPEAIDDFSHAIALDPRNARYYGNRAAAYVNLKSYANASTNYFSALTVNTNPNAAQGYKRLLDRTLAPGMPETSPSSGAHP